jgi:hypothetical protein
VVLIHVYELACKYNFISNLVATGIPHKYFFLKIIYTLQNTSHITIYKFCLKYFSIPFVFNELELNKFRNIILLCPYCHKPNCNTFSV